VIGEAGPPAGIEKVYASVQCALMSRTPYAMPRSNMDVFYCQELKVPLQQVMAAGQELALNAKRNGLRAGINVEGILRLGKGEVETAGSVHTHMMPVQAGENAARTQP